MNKLVVRTSLFWLAFIGLGFTAYLLWGSRRPGPTRPESVAPQPVAIGSAANDSHPSREGEARESTSLAPVQLSPERLQSIGVETAPVESGPVTDDIRATGLVGIDERLVSYVQVRFSGYIRQVFANAPLQFVKKGDPLFTIYSPELIAAENDYVVALRNRMRMSGSSIESAVSGAAELVSATEARLRQWDVPESVTREVRETNAPVTETTVAAPSSGYITERSAFPNLYVERTSRLYSIADLSKVWVDAQMPPEDLPRVKPGDAVEITTEAYPGRAIRGRVESILPEVDMSTRTGRVRVELPNPDLRLKPGMYVEVELKSALGSQITVPANAVLMSGTRSTAFLYGAGGQLTPREVELGRRVGDRLIILKGLSPGEKVVSSAAFLVDSESQLQAAAGAFAPPVPGAGAAAPTTTPQVNIEFTCVPSPPQRGENRFRVRLTDSQAKAITDARVSITFYMAAMPAMGMGAMTTTSVLAPTAEGTYEGSGVLGSGGTWQVTITAKRNGTVAASKQLSVTATGNM